MSDSRVVLVCVALFAISSAGISGCAAWYDKYGIRSEEELKEASSVPKLLQALKARDACAVQPLALLEPPPSLPNAVPDLLSLTGVTCVSWGGPGVSLRKNWVSEAIARVGGPASVPYLQRALGKNSDVSKRKTIVLALGNIGGPDVLRPLMLALGDPEAEVQCLAAQTLATHRTLTEDSVSLLTKMLSFEFRKEARICASDALAKIGSPLPAALQALEGVVSKPGEDEAVVEAAGLALRKLRVVAALNPQTQANEASLLASKEGLSVQPSIVAVFGVEDAGKRFAPLTMEQLTDYLSVRVAEVLGFRVVPQEQMRSRIVEAKANGFAACYDQACQIELGKALAAEKSLATKLLRVGGFVP